MLTTVYKTHGYDGLPIERVKYNYNYCTYITLLGHEAARALKVSLIIQQYACPISMCLPQYLGYRVFAPHKSMP